MAKLTRLELTRQIEAAYQELNRVYCLYVKPHSASAMMTVSAPRGKGKRGENPHEERTLTIEQADKLDRSTPTGAFEYGRAYVVHHSDEIRKLRRQLEAVEEAERRARPRLPAVFWRRIALLRRRVLEVMIVAEAH